MKYFFANWKMYLKEREALALARLLKNAKPSSKLSIVVFPSTLHLVNVSRAIGRIPLGVQDIGTTEYGAATGDTSAVEVKRLKAKYVLVGHSERRKSGENDIRVGKKFATALRAGLIPVLCVGETAEERTAGKQLDVVLEQIESAMREAGHLIETKKFFVAYEPVWAIGTGVSAEPKDVTEMHIVIRKELTMIAGEAGHAAPILYGGSVSPENVAEYAALPGVDGMLVGGASTKSKELKAMLHVLC